MSWYYTGCCAPPSVAVTPTPTPTPTPTVFPYDSGYLSDSFNGGSADSYPGPTLTVSVAGKTTVTLSGQADYFAVLHRAGESVTTSRDGSSNLTITIPADAFVLFEGEFNTNEAFNFANGSTGARITNGTLTVGLGSLRTGGTTGTTGQSDPVTTADLAAVSFPQIFTNTAVPLSSLSGYVAGGVLSFIVTVIPSGSNLAHRAVINSVATA